MTKHKIATKSTVEATNVVFLADHRLTLKRQAFVRAFIENGGNASAAYRAAYDAENMSAMMPFALKRIDCAGTLTLPSRSSASTGARMPKRCSRFRRTWKSSESCATPPRTATS